MKNLFDNGRTLEGSGHNSSNGSASILNHLDKLTPAKEKGKYICPICEDDNLSINLKTGAYQCWSTGCDTKDIWRAIVPFTPQTRQTHRRRPLKSATQKDRDATLSSAHIEHQVDELLIAIEQGRETPATAKIQLSNWCKEHGYSAFDAGQLLNERLKQRDKDSRDREPHDPSSKTDKIFNLAYTIAREASYFLTPGGDLCADMTIAGHRETTNLTTKPQAFRDWLAGSLWRQHRKTIGPDSLQQIISVLNLEAKADPQTKIRQTYLRVAPGEGAIYLDLGTPDWSVVQVDAEGWKVISSAECDARFVRSRAVGALPIPTLGGKISDLKQIFNVSDQDLVLLVSWLLFCLYPDFDHPILVVSGRAQTGKTKLCESLKRLIDPAHAVLMSLPKEDRTLKTHASSRWILGYDNLSGISNEISDNLCRLSTGGGMVERRLQTDDDPHEFSGVRPILLNGIEALGSRSDLRSRVVEIQCLPLDKKLATSEFHAVFNQLHPKTLGLLLSAASQAIRLSPGIQHQTDTRMGDFERWAIAAETAFGFEPGTFVQAYENNVEEVRSAGIEANPVATALLDLMKHQETWEGTPTELLTQLGALVSDETRKLRAFPKIPNHLTPAIKRAATDLEADLLIDLGHGRRTNKKRSIFIQNKTFHRHHRHQSSEVPLESSFSGDDDVKSIVTPLSPSSPSSSLVTMPSSPAHSSSPFIVTSETPMQKGFQPLSDDGDDGDDEMPSLCRGGEEWVRWWRIDTKVKVLARSKTGVQIRVPGKIQPEWVPLEEIGEGDDFEEDESNG
jgi:hypothetical protein